MKKEKNPEVHRIFLAGYIREELFPGDSFAGAGIGEVPLLMGGFREIILYYFLIKQKLQALLSHSWCGTYYTYAAIKAFIQSSAHTKAQIAMKGKARKCGKSFLKHKILYVH